MIKAFYDMGQKDGSFRKLFYCFRSFFLFFLITKLLWFLKIKFTSPKVCWRSFIFDMLLSNLYYALQN